MPIRYYQKNKEKLQKEARKSYQKLSEEKKNEQCQYPRERYQNLNGEEKPKSENIALNGIEICLKMKNKS